MALPTIGGTELGIPRTIYGSDGSNWYAILVDSDGHVKVDMVSAALPTDAATETTLALIKGYVDALETLLAGGLPAALDSGALKTKEQSPLTGFATSANQTTMITALQLIDDLRAALGSVNTDDLQVDVKTYPGSNALGNIPFGYNDRYAEDCGWTLTAASEINYSTPVPAGEVWMIQTASIQNRTGALTDFVLRLYVGASAYCTILRSADTPQYQPVYWNGQIVLKEGDKVGFVVSAGAIGEVIWAHIWGYKMKVA